MDSDEYEYRGEDCRRVKNNKKKGHVRREEMRRDEGRGID